MKQAIVGFAVGFPVGKSGRPDKLQPRVINGLSSFCRKCRVRTTEESLGELESRHSGSTDGLE